MPERPGTRFLPSASYLIYRVYTARKTVRILRFWHGARGRCQDEIFTESEAALHNSGRREKSADFLTLNAYFHLGEGENP